MVVKNELEKLGLTCINVELGTVKSELDNLGLAYIYSPHGAIDFYDGISEKQMTQLHNNLLKSGLALLSENESKFIDRIINTIIEVVHYSDALPSLGFADVINEHSIVGDESILKIFSDVKGMSILQFIVVQKVERVKEMMLYEDITLSEIAKILNYKNENYLVAQFKKITGLTPCDFKRMRLERLKVAERFKNSSPIASSRSKTSTG